MTSGTGGNARCGKAHGKISAPAQLEDSDSPVRRLCKGYICMPTSITSVRNSPARLAKTFCDMDGKSPVCHSIATRSLTSIETVPHLVQPWVCSSSAKLPLDAGRQPVSSRAANSSVGALAMIGMKRALSIASCKSSHRLGRCTSRNSSPFMCECFARMRISGHLHEGLAEPAHGLRSRNATSASSNILQLQNPV